MDSFTAKHPFCEKDLLLFIDETVRLQAIILFQWDPTGEIPPRFSGFSVFFPPNVLLFIQTLEIPEIRVT